MQPNANSLNDSSPPKRRESALNTEQKCRNHGKLYSHICKLEIKLLCPDCVKVHEKEHNLFEFEKAQEVVYNSIDGFQRKFRKSISDLNTMAFPDFGTFYNEQMGLISNAKMYIKDKINDYFTILEENFTKMFNKVPSLENKEKLLKQISSYIDYLEEIKKRKLTGMSAIELQEYFSKDIDGYEEELDRKFLILSKYNENPATELEIPEIVLREEMVSGLITQLPEYFGIRHSVYSNRKQKLFSNNSFKIDESFDNTQKSVIPLFDDVKGKLGFYSFDGTLRNSIPLEAKALKCGDSSKLILPNNSIFSCGGIEISAQVISNDAFLIEEAGNFKELPPMRVKRFAHSLCYVEDGQKGLSVYAIGGKTKENISTKLCERYSFKENFWESVAMMSLARSRASVCAWKGSKIFAFYGTDSNGAVLTSIEVFDIAKNFWKIISATNRLPYVEATCTFATPLNNSQIMIFGGFYETNVPNKQFSANTKLSIFNVDQETIEYESGKLDYHIFNYNDGGVVKNKGKILAIGRSYKENFPSLKMDMETFFLVGVSNESMYMEKIIKI